MKKIIVIVMLFMSFTLSACDDVTIDTVCDSGQVLIGDICSDIDDSVQCEVGEVKVNGVCVDDTVDECPSGQVLVDGECEEEIRCVPGFHEEDGACVEDIPEACEVGYHREDGVCVENAPEYTGRELVPDECDSIENVGTWQPVWCEEFSYTGLPNDAKWGYDVGGGGFGNNELQYYTNKDIDNAFVQDGYLTIKAMEESFGGNAYTSARLVTKNTGDWLYGKIQVKAQLPTGKGTWPAIWMLPTNWEYGGWPTSGEIDIMEHVGYDPNRIHGTIHTGVYNHMMNTQVGKSKVIPTAITEYHVYEIEWEPNVIRFYIDGIKYHEVEYNYNDITSAKGFESWPFDKEFHLILNIAFGGNWGGAQGVDPSVLPAEMLVDYVRVFQKNYAGMDQVIPEPLTNVKSLKTSGTEIYLGWDRGIDDIMVEEYIIMLNGTVVGTSTHNAFVISGLTPELEYIVSVSSIDFAGNISTPVDLMITTSGTASVDQRIQAEDYTKMSGIQTENTSDTGGGTNIGYVDTGDYLEYTLKVNTAGTYHVDFRFASQDGSSFDFYKGTDNLSAISLPATGGWQNWQTITSSSFTLDVGTYTFKVVATANGFNLNYFDFIKE